MTKKDKDSDLGINPKKQAVFALDPIAISAIQKAEEEELAASKIEGNGEYSAKRDMSHLGHILKAIKGQENIQRMAFEVDPQSNKTGAGSVWRQKVGLTPDHIIKRIAGPQGDDLVNQILQARSNFISATGRPRTSRFSIGFEFQEINNGSGLSEKEEKARLEQLKEIMWNCGHKGLDEDWHPNLSQFNKMITRDGLSFGRFAVERIYAIEPTTGKEKFHSFRAVDAGTIYRLMPAKEKDQTRRKQALELLQQVKNKKIDKEKYESEEYKWVQVVNGLPVQVFTDKELVVYNIYPTTNVEFNGYPLTPIDQALNAIATHINITLHNKLYFEHGRAARGMLVFKSDDIDEGTIQKIRLQFHQSINSVQNSWRMPVFAVGSTDDVSWSSIDIAGRDKEFQYMSDDNARVILGAFQISPDELPGYAHLSRGTNTQAMSESDNEYKLTAARDVGLRPLMYDIQDFFNTHIIPLFDKEMSKSHQMVLAGLDQDSPEKEATRLGQDMAIHMTYNDVLDQVEKPSVAKELGGELPLNAQFQQAIAPYVTVGVIMENFFGIKDASKDPRYNYIRDPFWLQYQQLMLQKAQMAMQTQMQAMQATMAPQQGQDQGGQDQGGQDQDGQDQGGQDQGAPPPEQQTAPAGASDEEKQDVSESNAKAQSLWLAGNFQLLSKAIDTNHNTISKMILKRHAEIAERNLKEWEKKSKQTIENILSAVDHKHNHDES